MIEISEKMSRLMHFGMDIFKIEYNPTFYHIIRQVLINNNYSHLKYKENNYSHLELKKMFKGKMFKGNLFEATPNDGKSHKIIVNEIGSFLTFLYTSSNGREENKEFIEKFKYELKQRGVNLS